MPRTAVVDANVVLKWFLAEPGHLQARELLREFVFGDTNLIAPRILSDEVASTLARKVRTKAISAGIARGALERFERYQPLVAGDAGTFRSAFELSLKYELSYWDAAYLALALEQRCDLVTAGARLHRATSRHYPYVVLLEG